MRPIDADTLEKQIKDWYCDPKRCDSYNGVRCRACHIDDALSEIDRAPTVDAVPINSVAKWLAGYAAPPNNIMREFFRSGAEITKDSLTAAWEMTLRGIDWEESPNA